MGLPGVASPYCKEVCSAFKNDFIPLVSRIYICQADEITTEQRFGSSADGYTEITASNRNTGKKIHFIFSDNMKTFSTQRNGNSAEAGWIRGLQDSR